MKMPSTRQTRGNNINLIPQPPTLNGAPFVGPRTFSGSVTARCWGGGNWACQIDSPDINARFDSRRGNYQSGYTITLKRVKGVFVAAGRAGGICGGLGEQQMTSYTFRRSKSRAARANYRGARNYPCKTCIEGGAFGVAMCQCEEWAVSEADSLVSEYVPLSDEARTEHAELAEVLKPTTSRLQQQGAAVGGGSGIDDLVDEEEEKFRATSIMGPLMKGCDNGACVDPDKQRMYQAIRDWAQDYALDAKNNVRSADAETPMFERDFCNEMRAMLEGDQAEKPKLCPLVTKCRKKYGKSADHEDLCGAHYTNSPTHFPAFERDEFFTVAPGYTPPPTV